MVLGAGKAPLFVVERAVDKYISDNQVPSPTPPAGDADKLMYSQTLVFCVVIAVFSNCLQF